MILGCVEAVSSGYWLVLRLLRDVLPLSENLGIAVTAHHGGDEADAEFQQTMGGCKKRCIEPLNGGCCGWQGTGSS